ncbi:osm1 [Symbiodinium sp. CCMP2592]|nr:osm1 [Symbiodinium sp. CCMP2592]
MKHVLMHVFLESFDVGPVKDPHGFAGRAAACAAGGSVFKDPDMGNTACCQSEANDGVADAHVDAKPILESALPAAPFISGGDSEQERIYQVTLSKSPGQKLGLDVDYMAERKILPIMHVTGGIAEEWNKKYPDRKLNSGDSILEVNGISGDVVEMLERCKADDTLKMKLCRCLTYEHLVEDLEKLVRRKECGPIMVRLSWHDAGIYNGADGCPNAAMRLPGGGEHALAANAGLPQVAIPLLEPLAAKYVPRMISHADLWALAANVAIKVMGGPEITTRFGRLDAERVGDGASSATGRLPDGDKDARHLRDIFYPKGFDDKAIVALSGAHTVGSCHLDRSGFDGAWTADKLKFDNSYFKDLMHRSWSSETTSKGNPQFRCAESKTMMLTTVLASVTLWEVPRLTVSDFTLILSASSCTIPSLRRNSDAMAAVFPANQVIVVGGGLAGMSAANTVVELGGRTILLDKSSFCGGNSTKAILIFIADTLKGGAKKPELAKVLCANSAADVDWLVDKFDLDLSLVARLGGHSQPRTHRGKERFPGMTITYALIQMLEKVAEKTNRARIVTKAEVYKLLVNAGTVVGCEYKKAGKSVKEFGPMVLASGGFGADFGADSLLATYRPDLLHLPTTNGEHCTGDAIKMGEAIGAATIDLEWVQVHPTGLVKPDDPDAKVKFLAAEALRGVGGIVLDANGDRFCNELGRRDYVTGEMWKNKPPFRLCLNKAAADEIIWHAKHYTGRGVMKFYASGEDLAKDMGVPLQKIVDAHQKHFEAAKKQEKDPDGGPFPAYPSGKTWDEPSGKTGSGKKFFHNIIDGSKVPTEPFYVAIITPVIHYCMGGLECTVDAECIDKKSGKVIPGLYVAGEAAGGIHGNNRLGGNSLLDCVVFGRVAGKAACKFTFGAGEKFKPCPPPGELKDLCK